VIRGVAFVHEGRTLVRRTRSHRPRGACRKAALPGDIHASAAGPPAPDGRGLKPHLGPADMPGMRLPAVRMLLLGCALMYSRDGSNWSVLDEFSSDSHCMRARSASVDAETQEEIGGALASQEIGNPMRQQAYGRASRRVAARYRCSCGDD